MFNTTAKTWTLTIPPYHKMQMSYKKYSKLLDKIYSINYCTEILNCSNEKNYKEIADLYDTIGGIINTHNLIYSPLFYGVMEGALETILKDELIKVLKEIKLIKLIYFCNTGKELKIDKFEKFISKHQELYDNII